MRAWKIYRARGMGALLGFWLALLLDVPQKVMAQDGVQDLFRRSEEIAQEAAVQFEQIWTNDFRQFMEIPTFTATIIAVLCLCWLFLTLISEHSYYGDVDWSKLTLPLLVVYVLITPNMPVDACMAIRNVVNTTNAQAVQATRLQTLYAHNQGNAAIRAVITASRERCDDLSPTERTQCLQNELPNIEKIIREQEALHGPLDWIAGWWDRFNDLSTRLANSEDALAAAIWLSAAPLWESVLFSVLNDITGAVYVALEVSMMLTSLLLPFSLALALSPMELKPVYAWLTGMIGIGLWKIMYTFCAGLGALLMSNALLSFGSSLGWFIAFFSPLLSLGLVAGGGFAIYQGILTLGVGAARSAIRMM